MRMLLAMSKAEIIALSEESFRVYKGCLPNKVHYVKAGVDTVQFTEIEKQNRERHFVRSLDTLTPIL